MEMMRIYYTEHQDINGHYLEFAPQMPYGTFVDRHWARSGTPPEIIRKLTFEEVAYQFWRRLYGDIYDEVEKLLGAPAPLDRSSYMEWRLQVKKLLDQVKAKQECKQFAKVEELNLEIFNKYVTLCRERSCTIEKLEVENLTLQRQVLHFQALYRNRLKQQRRKHRRNKQKY